MCGGVCDRACYKILLKGKRKMKRILSVAAALMLMCGIVSAAEDNADTEESVLKAAVNGVSEEKEISEAAAEEVKLYESRLGLHAELVKKGYIEREVTFKVYDASGEKLLAEKKVAVKNDDRSFNVEFELPEYTVGDKFIVRTEGGASAEYNGATGEELTLQPYVYHREDGTPLCQTVFYINLVTEAQKRDYTVYFSGSPVNYPYYLCGDEIYMDERLFSDLRIERVNDGESLTLYSENGNKSMSFFKDDIYALNNWVGYNLKHPAFTVDGVFYVPISDVADVFMCSCSVKEEASKVDISVLPSAYEIKAEEKFVNEGGYESKTDRLIWVSKKDFRVHFFKGGKNSWILEASYPCTIGTDWTPTIEGEFEYIERLNRWTYATYYCGPVMRFHNGYALHSTLLRYDGTPYDNRVEMKLSHGCVRLHPEDINYLVSATPFKTKILITA